MSGDDASAQGFLVVEEIDAHFRPTTAISSPDELSGKVAVFAISPETILVEGMFTDRSSPGTQGP